MVPATVPLYRRDRRSLCERLEVLSSYMTFFPPDDGVLFTILTERDLQSVLHNALPHRYIRKMKESN
jgi:hypothetical protein